MKRIFVAWVFSFILATQTVHAAMPLLVDAPDEMPVSHLKGVLVFQIAAPFWIPASNSTYRQSLSYQFGEIVSHSGPNANVDKTKLRCDVDWNLRPSKTDRILSPSDAPIRTGYMDEQSNGENFRTIILKTPSAYPFETIECVRTNETKAITVGEIKNVFGNHFKILVDLTAGTIKLVK